MGKCGRETDADTVRQMSNKILQIYYFYSPLNSLSEVSYKCCALTVGNVTFFYRESLSLIFTLYCTFLM